MAEAHPGQKWVETDRRGNGCELNKKIGLPFIFAERNRGDAPLAGAHFQFGEDSSTGVRSVGL